MIKPTTILTGFLGAGKTTLLNAILSERRTVRYAIIENEIGSESIDGELILKSDDQLIELNDGCLCCTLNDDLYQTLNQLHSRRDEFDELIIECTGIANPATVALPFTNHPAVKSDFPLHRVICLVDAELIEDQLRETDEALRQISFSDIILINKTDQITDSYLLELENILRKINPLAFIVSGQKAQYPLEQIFQFQKNERLTKRAFRLDRTTAIESNSHGEITALSFRYTETFDIQFLYHRLRVFLRLQAKDVFRFKALVNGNEIKHKIIIQSVGENISIDNGDYWEADTIPVSRFVFIGKNLKPEGLEKMLKQCMINIPGDTNHH